MKLARLLALVLLALFTTQVVALACASPDPVVGDIDDTADRPVLELLDADAGAPDALPTDTASPVGWIEPRQLEPTVDARLVLALEARAPPHESPFLDIRV